jgi:cell shape-determining protein MreC
MIKLLEQQLTEKVDLIEMNVAQNEKLQHDLDKEREEKGKLLQQLNEHKTHLEDERRMARDFSFASSEFQVCSAFIIEGISAKEA